MTLAVRNVYSYRDLVATPSTDVVRTKLFVPDRILSNEERMTTSLTTEGRCRIRDCVRAYDQQQGFSSTVEDKLKRRIGTTELDSDVYSFPRTHDGHRLVNGDADSYVLKVCYNCVAGFSHEHCFITEESWIWKEAVRRGDEGLFAPIIAYDRDDGWEVMAYCTPFPELAEPKSRVEASSIGKSLLREHGWDPIDIKGDVMSYEGRPVIVDYEKVYPKDMVTEDLYLHSFEFIRRSIQSKQEAKEMNQTKQRLQR